MEKKLLESHKQCSQIAKDRSQAVKNMTIVEQVQVYQGCVSFVSVFGQMLFFQINRGKPEIQKFSFKKLMYFSFTFFCFSNFIPISQMDAHITQNCQIEISAV